MTPTLLELAAMCETAEGPDRELDAGIFREVVRPSIIDDPDWNIEILDRILARLEAGGDDEEIPAYTASLDAAMTLVPEGWRVDSIGQNWRTGDWLAQLCARVSMALIEAFDAGEVIGYDDSSADAVTPALALCAAALRARARTQEGVE